MTYNIRGGLGMDGVRSTSRIAEVIARETPDIVCLQEVHRRLPWSGFIDQPELLRRALAMPVHFFPLLRMPFGGYGLAIATNPPATSYSDSLLPRRLGIRERRGVSRVDLGRLAVFTTHWGLNGEERRAQATRLAELIRSHRGPSVVCGDLNIGPSDTLLADFLTWSGLMDLGEAENTPTYPSDNPRIRIDYLLASAGAVASGARVVDTRASDHLPVVVDIEGTME